MIKYTLNTARNCLRIIIRSYGIKEIYIPYYICPAIWQACRAENCNIKFYHIDKKFYPIGVFDINSYILYPNYFGICAQNVLKLSNIYHNLIVDNAHAYFMPNLGLASFNSCRKFFKCADGAELYINNSNIQLPTDEYIYKKTPANYNDFVKNELRLDKEPPKFINKCSKTIIDKLDLEEERQIRIAHFNKLAEKLSESNELKISLNELDVPFVYPYLSDIEINDNIIRYWSPLPKEFPEYDFYKRLQAIPLKCHT